uniref:ATP synthase F0 subunit 8 n=1 Tax=Myrmoplasta mira TaxID=2653830 RepID=A0A5P8DK33_9HEMI|nr:ATP synthase F0 subunit 8 [Myrmoplasta mira]
MPQMAPLWWEYLYILTLIMMMITSIFIYHNKINKLMKKSLKYSTKNINWKW